MSVLIGQGSIVPAFVTCKASLPPYNPFQPNASYLHLDFLSEQVSFATGLIAKVALEVKT